MIYLHSFTRNEILVLQFIFIALLCVPLRLHWCNISHHASRFPKQRKYIKRCTEATHPVLKGNPYTDISREMFRHSLDV
jgi:hypothetical protein